MNFRNLDSEILRRIRKKIIDKVPLYFSFNYTHVPYRFINLTTLILSLSLHYNFVSTFISCVVYVFPSEFFFFCNFVYTVVNSVE